jgi:hypothetical protein
MKVVSTVVSCLFIMLLTQPTFGIDRDANMIDAIWLDATTYDLYDSWGVRVTGENVVRDTGGEWAIITGIGGGQFDYDSGSDFDAISVSLGVKRYLFQNTSLALFGSYTWNDADVDYEVGAVTASLKQRLLSASNALSPFVRIDSTVQFVDTDDSYKLLVVSAIAGCDFMMTDSMAIVFEGGTSTSEDLDDGVEKDDGWLFSVAMQYYWE